MSEQTEILTQKDLYEKEIDTDKYSVNTEPGEFIGILKLKAWTSKSKRNGHGRVVRAFLDLDDGRSIIALVQPFRSEQIAKISLAKLGSVMRLRFETSSSGHIFLAGFEVLTEPEE